MSTRVKEYSRFSEFDIHLFKEGKHYHLFEKLGSHKVEHQGVKGVCFAVWAPNASRVNVIGNFNGWNANTHTLNPRWDSSGIWEGFIPNIENGELYKYAMVSNSGQYLEKGDPYARRWEVPPKTASMVWDVTYDWKDKRWMKARHKKNAIDAPQSVYEVHLGSWRKRLVDGEFFSYLQMADEMVAYVKDMGFTHIEFMPIMEHPFYGSWGYQIHGYFAPTSRYGSPEDFKQLVQAFHQAGIGVILDWVPSHFPDDAHGLFRFDGSALYEHADPRQGYHPDWSSYIFNYGRNEVRSFLISNALFWLKEFHADGLRVDAVASMLYLDYSRKADEWVPNEHGGRENLEAIRFMKDLNVAAYGEFEDIQIIAEESTAWPALTKPVFSGGLGFGQKWMMGWMNDTLSYFSVDTLYRSHHHHEISRSLTYAFTENFMLPLSHDEVVHGKGALIERMPGDEWQRFANLRLLFGYMFTHPGTKLLFMGSEIAQTTEWKHDEALHWYLLESGYHFGMQHLVRDLNHWYAKEEALYEQGTSDGFEWIDHSNGENCVLAYIRKGQNDKHRLLVACNFSTQALANYRIGLPTFGKVKEVFNTDLEKYGGSDLHHPKPIKTEKISAHGKEQSVSVQLPALAMVAFKIQK